MSPRHVPGIRWHSIYVCLCRGIKPRDWLWIVFRCSGLCDTNRSVVTLWEWWTESRRGKYVCLSVFSWIHWSQLWNRYSLGNGLSFESHGSMLVLLCNPTCVWCRLKKIVFFHLDINECDSNPCLNGGSCDDHIASYTCRCVTGYSGLRCQTSMPVHSSPAPNHILRTDLDECTQNLHVTIRRDVTFNCRHKRVCV